MDSNCSTTTTTSTSRSARGVLPDLARIGETKLAAICEALGVDGRRRQLARHTFRSLTQPWLRAVPGDRPGWRSDITDDHSPFEFSLSFGNHGRDIRMLVEAQDEGMTEHRGWKPGVELTHRLGREPGVSLARFEQIRDLFAPDRRVPARFALWHAAAVPEQGPALYKIYLNPQVLGPDAAPELVRQAFARLHLSAAWTAVEQLLGVACDRNEILYLALDLSATPDSRVKVYVAHHGARSAALEQQLSRFSSYQVGDATRLTRELADSDGPFCQRPLLTCLGFVEGRPVPEVTVHLPVRCYARDDGQVVDRMATAVGGRAGADLARAIAAYGGRRLADGRGLVTYVSLRGAREGTRVVAYLSPEIYAVEPAEEAPPRGAETASGGDPAIPGPVSRSQGSMMDVVAHVARRQGEIARHPFIQILERGEVADLGPLVQGLTFFVMAFQDVLRLAAQRANDPRLIDIARAHHLEDAGHDRWFLHDLGRLGLEASLAFVFSSDHQIPRDVGYALVAEVLQASDDCDRLAVVFALEAVGHVFFEPAIHLFERRDPANRLQYFARHHQRVEQSHELFEERVQATLAEVKLTDDRLAGVCATVDRTVAQMSALADSLRTRLACPRENVQAA